MKLTRTLLGAAAGVMLLSVPALAQNPNRSADALNARVLQVLQQGMTPPAAPAPVAPVVAPVTTSASTSSGLSYYGGILAGSTFQNNSQVVLGGVAGLQFNPNYALELAFDANVRNAGQNGYLVMANAVYQREIPGTGIRPYALAGIGMGMGNYVAPPNQDITAMWNLGAGVRVPVVSQVEADLRYRYVAPFNTQTLGNSSNIVTLGVNYRW